MNVPVLWVSRHPEILARGYADQGLLEAVLDRRIWRPPDAVRFDHHEVRGDFPDVDGALVVLNCRTHASPDDVSWFVGQLDRLAWSVVLLCGDEEWVFPWREVTQHEHRRVWAMQGRPEHAELSGLLPGGWYPGTDVHLAAAGRPERTLDWFFAGQITNARRESCAAALHTMGNGRLVETSRYLEEAIPRADYFAEMARSRVVPCPSGPYSVDCARTFEALEAGCVPVADIVTAHAGDFDYWTLLFGEGPPFPRIRHWEALPRIVERLIERWPAWSQRTWSFWQQYKRRLAHRLDDDLRAVSGVARALDAPDDQVTVIVTTSPAPLHPSTEHLERTVASIRAQLPHAEIIVVADGVRPEQADRRAAYDEYLARLLWLTNVEWRNVVPVVLSRWSHQAHATAAALELVTTPLVLFVEHDTPLDGAIDWEALCWFVGSGHANAVRFLETDGIHPEHESIYLDQQTTWQDGDGPGGALPLRRTVAWWQRPHLARVDFYRDRIMPLFGPESRTMIEEVVYAKVASEYADRGEAAWWDWRLWVYTPEGSMRRHVHLDSRGDDPKYPMVFAGTALA